MDFVIGLRELRARADLTQAQAAQKSGIGAKTISSFESGSRIASMRLSQLKQLLDVYGVTLAYFFSDEFAAELCGPNTPHASGADAFRFEDLPAPIRASLAAWASRLAVPSPHLPTRPSPPNVSFSAR
jgi:transcriptional regulator with XRE-family HTH domain